MNAILTRYRQNHTSVSWEPYATSTPLKIPPSTNLEVENVLRKQSQLTAAVSTADKNQSNFTNSSILQIKSPDSRHLPKRVRKNTSANFDVLTISSDEDESNENRKRPIIKLGSRKKTRSFLGNKKFESEDTGIVNKINPNNKVTDSKKVKSKTEKHVASEVTDFGPEGSQLSNSREKTQHPIERLQCGFSSDEENKIFDESISDKKLTSNIKSPSSKYKKKLIKSPKGNEKLDSSESQRTEEMPKINDAPIKSIKRDLCKGVKDSCTTISENSELTKKSKKKKVTNMSSPVKKTRRKKYCDKPPEKILKTVRNTETPQQVLQNKHNLSHQLFSESKEQEFINMLDLTKDEVSEAAEVTKCSARQKGNNKFLKPFASPHPSIQNTCSNVIKNERPKRTKQIPKEFWLVLNTPDKSSLKFPAKKQKQQGTKSNDYNQQIQVPKESEEASTKISNPQGNKGAKHVSVKRQKTSSKEEKKAGDVMVEKAAEFENILNIEDIKLNNETQGQPPSETCKTKDAEPNQNAFSSTEEEKAVDNRRPVFQRLNELSCKKNVTGCSVEECLNLRNFKCGIFMLKVNAQFACETLHKNNHLGGVLVKGALKMKIGDEDLDLKEGDMAFVPPLTKWQATNIGDCESVFYYWCGKFTG